MNLPLHPGWPGALEAGLIAFAIGVAMFGLLHAIGRRGAWQEGRAFGWACLLAAAVGAGTDIWHLVPLYTVNPGNAARIRSALAGLHDPQWLGARVLAELVGALSGALSGWLWAESRKGKARD